MSETFLAVGLLLLSICALLYFIPNLKILNFVDYGPAHTTGKINRYASIRLLLPMLVFTAASFLAQARPALTVALLFLSILSILTSVVWIAAGLSRLSR